MHLHLEGTLVSKVITLLVAMGLSTAEIDETHCHVKPTITLEQYTQHVRFTAGWYPK